jgi:hypothetical protein
MVLGELLSRGALTGSQPARVLDLVSSLPMTENEFWITDGFLLKKRFVEVTMGGIDGDRWITAEGAEYYERSKIQAQPPVQNIFHGSVSNSQIQTVGSAVDSVVKQVVGVEKVREAISTTIDELLATLKPELRQKDQLESYLRTAQEFKEEVSKEAPSKAILARLLSSLSFACGR